MGFRDRARNGLAGLVLLGASAGLGGCGALIIAAGEENAAHVRGHYEVEAAKIRANAQRSPEYRNEFFACNYVEDLDGDNAIGENEVFGKKKASDPIYPGETVTFVAILQGLQGKVLTARRSFEGHIAPNIDEVKITTNNYAHTFSYDLPDEMPAGVFEMNWSINGIYVGKTSVNVSEGRHSSAVKINN